MIKARSWRKKSIRKYISCYTETFRRRLLGRLFVKRWPPYSRVFLKGDSASWVIYREMHELTKILRKIGIKVASPHWLSCSDSQAVFYGSHFFLTGRDWLESPHRIGTAYFHGEPGTGIPEFDLTYERLCRYHHRIHRIQVSHKRMMDVILGSAIGKEKVYLIPIGVNLEFFALQTPELKRNVRQSLGLPQSAALLGSFQKDGVGWDEGDEPKWIKGPDIFLRTIEILRTRIPELMVLLSGPARGYVKKGLKRMGIPFRHILVDHYSDIGQLYHALDVYIVSSRQEGGPKAVLEAMASGVPLVTTRVGQAMDLVRHGANGWMVETEDAEGLAHWAEYVLTHRQSLDHKITEGRRTAERHAYAVQLPLWRRFMEGFVEWAD